MGQTLRSPTRDTLPAPRASPPRGRTSRTSRTSRTMRLSTAIALVMVLAISAIFLVRQSTAYRDASRPIQDLAATADLIVLADVEQVTSAGDRETAGGAAMPPG